MRYDNNKPMLIRYAIYAVVLVVAVLLQNSRGAFPELFGARAFVVLPLCVAVAMHEREIAAAIFGAVAGVLLDVCTANDGFNSVVLMLLCAVCSLLISHFMQNNVVTAFVLAAGTITAYNLLYVLANIVLAGGSPVRQLLLFYLPSTVYTMVFVPVYYFLIRWIWEKAEESGNR
ncbi:MAG: rod shape-determining protein MreD [Clostridia bacterium]|nr:rod shape-determining protein MreD [Clostridia bacterium]